MNRVQTIYWLLRKIGPRTVGMRVRIYVDRLLGSTHRQFSMRHWESISMEEICAEDTPTEPGTYAAFKRQQSMESFFALGQPPKVPNWLLEMPPERRPSLSDRLRLIAADRAVYCFRWPSPAPLDWNANSLNGTRCKGDRIWCEIADFDPTQGDMRLLWDPARAAWAIDLVRAQARGILPDAGRYFWHWVDSWMSACPPWNGPHWKCGQESFVRLLALVFALWGLADDPATTPARWTQLARLAWATGYRIEHHINYAQSQKNNHALSEACGLMLVGHLFPELREAERWFKRGRRIFSEELARQMYADGSYVQHSHNYHRVMLQTAVMAAQLTKWHGQPFDDVTMQHIARAEEFLFQMLDPETGRVPLYGNNDGAWVLPLDECDYSDFRGAIQAAHYLTTGRRRFASGAWDEDLLWLFGPKALDSPQDTPKKPESTAFRDGGYFTLRGDNSWGMIRCHTYRDRPGQYDPLHFDLWYKGQNLLRDCGTYQYFPPEGRAMEDYFQLIRSHNTVEIDATSPIERVSRFLYFPWPRAAVRRFDAGGSGFQSFEGESRDYDRRPWHVLHRRTVVSLDSDVWLIVDDLLGAGRHTATLRWHLADASVTLDQAARTAVQKLASGDWTVGVFCCSGKPWDRLEVVRGRFEPDSIQGFASPYYGERIPIPVLEAELQTQFPARLLTVAAFGSTIRWRPMGNNSTSGEQYELHVGGKSWQLELGRLERQSAKTIVQIRPLHQVAGTRGVDSAWQLSATVDSSSKR